MIDYTYYEDGTVHTEETGAETRLFNESGRLVAITYKSWGTITYTYDDLRHLAIATYPDGSRVNHRI